MTILIGGSGWTTVHPYSPWRDETVHEGSRLRRRNTPLSALDWIGLAPRPRDDDFRRLHRSLDLGGDAGCEAVDGSDAGLVLVAQRQEVQDQILVAQQAELGQLALQRIAGSGAGRRHGGGATRALRLTARHSPLATRL